MGLDGSEPWENRGLSRAWRDKMNITWPGEGRAFQRKKEGKSTASRVRQGVVELDCGEAG